MSYDAFIASKRLVSTPVGFAIDETNPKAFDFQRDIIKWSVRRGRAAIFCDCGLGKSLMQLDWARIITTITGGSVLILAPLAVAQQTVREGMKFGIATRYVRSQSDVTAPGIYVANYDMLHAFDADAFIGVVLDESSILKAYDGKTRTAIIDAFQRTPYKLACTATPAPNDFMELGNHAEFLGVMTRAEMLSMFFVHDGGETQTWRLKGHAQDAFWRWVCSWACMVRKPSDLGYDDGAFTLPPLHMHSHMASAGEVRPHDGGMLFAMEARTLQERRDARRASLAARVKIACDLANADREPWLVWCDLNAEGDAITDGIVGAIQVAGSNTAEEKESRMLGFAEGKHRVMVSKPSVAGWGMNWQHCARVAFVGLSDSYEAFYQAIRRCWRFGQQHPVHCHVISSELEGAVVQNIQRKEADAQRMASEMVRHMRDEMNRAVRGLGRDVVEYNPRTPLVVPSWIGVDQ